MACTQCCMGIIGAGEGATRMRPVGVLPRVRAHRWDRDVGGRKACPCSGHRLPAPASRHHAGQRSSRRLRALAPAPDSGRLQNLPWLQPCRHRVTLLYKQTFCSSTQCTYRLQSYCNAQRNQTALFWQHSCLNFEPNLAFWANYIIITCFTCFPSLLPSLLLIESNIFRPSLFHSLLHCYYHIIIMASLFSLSRLSLCDY